MLDAETLKELDESNTFKSLIDIGGTALLYKTGVPSGYIKSYYKAKTLSGANSSVPVSPQVQSAIQNQSQTQIQSQSFFNKNKKYIIIGGVVLIIGGLIYYFVKR